MRAFFSILAISLLAFTSPCCTSAPKRSPQAPPADDELTPVCCWYREIVEHPEWFRGPVIAVWSDGFVLQSDTSRPGEDPQGWWVEAEHVQSLLDQLVRDGLPGVGSFTSVGIGFPFDTLVIRTPAGTTVCNWDRGYFAFSRQPSEVERKRASVAAWSRSLVTLCNFVWSTPPLAGTEDRITSDELAIELSRRGLRTRNGLEADWLRAWRNWRSDPGGP